MLFQPEQLNLGKPIENRLLLLLKILINMIFECISFFLENFAILIITIKFHEEDYHHRPKTELVVYNIKSRFFLD